MGYPLFHRDGIFLGLRQSEERLAQMIQAGNRIRRNDMFGIMMDGICLV
jgi:hypothetical protein